MRRHLDPEEPRRKRLVLEGDDGESQLPDTVEDLTAPSRGVDDPRCEVAAHASRRFGRVLVFCQQVAPPTGRSCHLKDRPARSEPAQQPAERDRTEPMDRGQDRPRVSFCRASGRPRRRARLPGRVTPLRAGTNRLDENGSLARHAEHLSSPGVPRPGWQAIGSGRPPRGTRRPRSRDRPGLRWFAQP